MAPRDGKMWKVRKLLTVSALRTNLKHINSLLVIKWQGKLQTLIYVRILVELNGKQVEIDDDEEIFKYNYNE